MPVNEKDIDLIKRDHDTLQAKVRQLEDRLKKLEVMYSNHTGNNRQVVNTLYPHPNISAVKQGAYTVTNGTNDRTYDADASSTAELADVLGQVIADLQRLGILG